MTPAEMALTASVLINGAFDRPLTTGWEGAWSRSPGAATARVESGALRITHSGSRDWSVEQSAEIPVRPGEVWRITGRVRIVRLDGAVQLGVTLRDRRGEVLEWVYGTAETSSAHGWKDLSSGFLIPPECASMKFRITGSGPGEGRVDDLALVRIAPPPGPAAITPVDLGGTTLRLSVSSDGSWTVAAPGGTWRSAAPAGAFVVERAERTGPHAVRFSLRDRVADLAIAATLAIHPTEPECIITLTASPTAELAGRISWPEPFASRTPDLLFLPYAEGIVVPAADARKGWGFTWFEWKDGFDYGDWKTSLGFAAVAGPDGSGYSVHLDTPWDATILTPVVDGRRAIGVRWKPSKGTFAYDRKLIIRFTRTGGHVALAMRHRDLMIAKGWHRTFAEKAKTRPAVSQLPGAVNLWMLDRNLAPDFLDDLKASGVSRAVVSVGGGWREPQDADALVRKANALGYLGSRYDIYTDAWNPADHPPAWQRTAGYPEDVIVDADGRHHTGWLDKTDHGNFQGYYLCSRTHRKAAQERIGAEIRRTPYAARFIDVVTASGLYECFSPIHPATRRDDALARADMLKLVSDEFRLVTGSEEIREWAIPYSDWSEGTMTIKPAENAGYDWGRPVEGDPDYFALTAGAAHRVPLFELVFHDCHQASWYTGDGMTKVPAAWDAKDLLCLLYGTMPLWMPDADLWKKHRDRFLDSYRTVNAVGAAIGAARMTNHEFLTTDRLVQRTTYASGHVITANFGDRDYAMRDAKGVTLHLPKFGFLADGPGLNLRRVTPLRR